MPSSPGPAQEAGPALLFQARRRLGEDDLRAFYDLERRKYRSMKGLLIYIRACAFITALGLIFASGALIFWSMYASATVTIWAPLLLLVWLMAVLPAVVLLIQYAFPQRIKKSPLKQSPDTVFSFYADHFTVSDENSTVHAQYKVISKYVEKDARFFIFLSNNVAYILQRSSFVVGTPEEFSRFMREKYRTKDLPPAEETTRPPEKGL